jgi:hypothetical protein
VRKLRYPDQIVGKLTIYSGLQAANLGFPQFMKNVCAFHDEEHNNKILEKNDDRWQ